MSLRLSSCCIAWVLAIFLCAASVTGCAAHRYYVDGRLVDLEMAAAPPGTVRSIYPSSCRLTQHIVVRVRGDEYDLVGYLYLREDGSWSAVALGDMGIELFRLQRIKGVNEVIRCPESMPMAPILGGVAADIQHLFGQKETVSAYRVQSPTRGCSVVTYLGGDALEEFQFDEQSGRLIKSRSIVDGVIVREASYHGTTVGPEIRRSPPRRIVLYNFEWDYYMEIELLEIRDGGQH